MVKSDEGGKVEGVVQGGGKKKGHEHAELFLGEFWGVLFEVFCGSVGAFGFDEFGGKSGGFW